MARVERLGLVAGNAKVPLRSVSTNAVIQGYIAKVEATLTYHNDEDTAVEAVFVFPVDDQSAVYRLEAEIDGHQIVAECQERQTARETYNDALMSGHAAVLMEEHESAGDMFRCKLGNLSALSDAKVTFAYMTELSTETDGGLRFTLPSVLNPRYNPSKQDGGADPDSLKIRFLCGNNSPYSFQFSAVIISEDAILKFSSEKDNFQTHLKIEDDFNIMEVKLASSHTLDHDLSFCFLHDNLHEPHAVLEKGSQQKGPGNFFQKDVLMLNFYPRFEEDCLTGKGEFIFVIDRSGSMDGERIASAKQALLYFLKSLPVGCYFNIISFGSTHDSLFKNGSMAYNEHSLETALKNLSSMDADMGGTEILRPLEQVYRRPCLPDHPRQIFLVTDGDVHNKNAVVSLVKSHAADTRVFTVGIGSGASTSLVRNVAKAGNGKAEFVTEKERLQQKVIQLLKKAMQPSVSDLKLDLDLPKGVTSTLQIPSSMPVIFGGDRCILYVFIEGLIKNEQKGHALLSGYVGLKPFRFDLNFDFSMKTSPALFDQNIHRMALKFLIKDLELQDSNKMREIIMASTAANVVSRYTTFVGVDKESKQPLVGQLKTRDIPIGIGRRYLSSNSHGGRGRGGSYVKKNCMNSRCRSRSRERTGQSPKFRERSRKRTKSRDGSRSESDEDKESFHVTKVGPEIGNPLGPLIAMQKFDGSWSLTGKLATQLGKTLGYLKKISPIKSEAVWATLLAVQWLNIQWSSLKDEWEMIVEKAKTWLKRQSLGVFSVDHLLLKANEAIDNSM